MQIPTYEEWLPEHVDSDLSEVLDLKDTYETAYIDFREVVDSLKTAYNEIPRGHPRELEIEKLWKEIEEEADLYDILYEYAERRCNELEAQEEGAENELLDELESETSFTGMLSSARPVGVITNSTPEPSAETSDQFIPDYLK